MFFVCSFLHWNGIVLRDLWILVCCVVCLMWSEEICLHLGDHSLKIGVPWQKRGSGTVLDKNLINSFQQCFQLNRKYLCCHFIILLPFCWSWQSLTNDLDKLSPTKENIDLSKLNQNKRLKFNSSDVWTKE